MVSLRVQPVRTFGAHGDTWTVSVVRANKWATWRWLERLERLASRNPVEGPLLVIPFYMLAAPSIVGRWFAYRLRRRTDWRCLVYAGVEPEYRPRTAIVNELHATREAAELRGEELTRALRRSGRGALTPLDG